MIKMAQPHMESEREILPPQAASRRVLVVEDEKRLREMLHASISEMGLTPSTAGSAEAALRLVAHEFFAVAVVDLNLPGMNGLEFCEQLSRIKPHIQVIILTGFGDLEAAQKAIRLQVVDFLTKPSSMDDLENALNRARLRWLDRWADGDRPVETQMEFSEPEPATLQVSSAVPIDPNEQHSIDEMERQLILAALTRHAGNRQAAATELGISVRKIYYRIQQYQRLGLMPVLSEGKPTPKILTEAKPNHKILTEARPNPKIQSQAAPSPKILSEAKPSRRI